MRLHDMNLCLAGGCPPGPILPAYHHKYLGLEPASRESGFNSCSNIVADSGCICASKTAYNRRRGNHSLPAVTVGLRAVKAKRFQIRVGICVIGARCIFQIERADNSVSHKFPFAVGPLHMESAAVEAYVLKHVGCAA